MFRYVALLLIAFTAHSISAQQDSLRKLLPQFSGKQKVDLLIELARAYQTSYPDSVLQFGELAYKEAESSNYNRGKAAALWAKALGYRLLAKYDNSLETFYQAKTWAVLSESKELEAEIDMGIGGVYYYQNRTDSALTYFIKASESFEKLGLEKRLAAAYSNLGMIMNVTREWNKAFYYFGSALHYAEKSKEFNVWLPVLVNLAFHYEQVEQYDSAIYYAEACYKIAKENNLPYGMARALMILPSAYSKQNSFQKALNLTNEGSRIFLKLGDSINLKSLIYQRAVAFNGLGDKIRALQICDSLILHLNDSQPLKESTFLLASEILTDLGQPERALLYYKQFFNLYSNASIQKQQDLISELEIKYDTERKSREIEELNNKAKLQEILIRQQHWVLIAGILFAVVSISLILLFNRQRLLIKENRMLELEQRFLRSQMNPHFIFNALGAIQKFIIKSNPIEGASFISKFGALMRQFLNHSRQNYISIEEEIKTLTNYLTIQQLRFDSKFEFLIHVDDQIDKEFTMIPPLLAQPFIENSLEHGISNRLEPGRIEIHFVYDEGEIILKIIDNGIGLNHLKSNGHESLATKITQERLELLQKEKKSTRLTIKDRLDAMGNIIGVEVIIVVPIQIAIV
jgi:tetratricopeptide (TPR) repeat protein